MSRKHVEPWDRVVQPYRLGLKMSPTAGNPFGEAAIGFAVMPMGHRILEAGEDEIGSRSPTAAAIERAEKMRALDPNFGGVDLYVYANQAAFKGSRPHREGMSLDDHTRSVKELESALRLRCIDVKLIRVTRPL